MDKRLQIDFSESAYRDLVALQKRLDARSKSEVIRNALGLLQWLMNEIGAKNRLILQRPDGSEREVVFHFLDRTQRLEEAAVPSGEAESIERAEPPLKV